MMDPERPFKNFSPSSAMPPNSMNHIPPSYTTMTNTGYTPYVGAGNSCMPPISSSMTLPLAPPGGVNHGYGSYADTGHCTQNMYSGHHQHGYNLPMLHAPPMAPPEINLKKEHDDNHICVDAISPVAIPIVTSSSASSNMNGPPALIPPPTHGPSGDTLNSPPGGSLNKSDDSTTDSNSSESSMKDSGSNNHNIPPKKRARSVSDEKKDPNYWEKRKKNNESAKRSRDSRRMKEEQIAMRVVYLEQENLQLRTEVSLLRSEIEKLRCMLYNS